MAALVKETPIGGFRILAARNTRHHYVQWATGPDGIWIEIANPEHNEGEEYAR